jgi:hypothetical protein
VAVVLENAEGGRSLAHFRFKPNPNTAPEDRGNFDLEARNPKGAGSNRKKSSGDSTACKPLASNRRFKFADACIGRAQLFFSASKIEKGLA